MRFALVGVLLAACSSSGTGTVVYSEGGTGNIYTVDVATGDATLLDLGFFGDVSIAPDRQHVAYMGTDLVPKVTDLEGDVIALPSTNGCISTLDWGPNNTLSYCAANNLGNGVRNFMPGIGAQVRTISSPSFAITSDGARVAYLALSDPNTAVGDFVVEDAAGANRQILLSNVEIFDVVFTPDDRSLVYTIVDDMGTQHLATLALANPTPMDLGEGQLVLPLPNGARFSPDGHEILALLTGMLASVDLGTGNARKFSMVPSGTQIIGAAFLDADKIVYARQDSQFEGDVGSTSSSVRFSDGTDRVTLVSSDGSSQCNVTDVQAAAGQIGLDCAVPAIVDLDGELITSRNASLELGISADHDGMVTIDNTGLVEYVADDGSVRTLADASTSDLAGQLFGPFAAYAR